ncbi:DUF4339 domain-containing protein [Prosthecobacter vanneervenii]|uniref:GYF domain-containing protein n=1 Tax=Prosthecobacter vanneervenii TaxID=48466 RepID=A0A7W8DKE2_9BACT|nr:DUF4339 domain-containing protein [Prosthecobacter vanneervenii]MBB5033154.1 hypothetical protein [Prosthecobacter vanneervenii]
MTPSKSLQFFIWQNSQSIGPYTTAVIKLMLQRGRVTTATLAAKEGSDEWKPIQDYSELENRPLCEAAMSVRRHHEEKANASDSEPAAEPEKKEAVEVVPPVTPFTVEVVVEWLQNLAILFAFIAMGVGLVAAAIVGVYGLWFAVSAGATALMLWLISVTAPRKMQ